MDTSNISCCNLGCCSKAELGDAARRFERGYFLRGTIKAEASEAEGTKTALTPRPHYLCSWLACILT